MGDTERLVQVQVGDITSELAGLRNPQEGVQVRAVVVHLTAMVVHPLTKAA
jgi:hypothetical protein